MTTIEKPKIIEAEPQKTHLSFEDFKKIEMKVGKILAAEPLEGASKLLKLEVDIGDERRQILAGIAEFYTPEQLVGMNVVVVVNLEPKKMRGAMSQGMILAADGEKPVLLSPIEDVAPGTVVR